MATSPNNPIVNITKRAADVPPDLSPQNTLILGMIGTGGSATAGKLYNNIASTTQAASLFGDNSEVAHAARCFLKINTASPLSIIALDPSMGSVAAAATVTFTGTATAAGQYTFNIVSKNDYGDITINVVDTDTADTIGGKLETALNAVPNKQWTAANVSGVVTITLDVAGSFGNDSFIRIQDLQSNGTIGIAGVTVALTAFAGGSGVPDVTGVFDAVGGKRFQTVIYNHSFDLEELKTFLDARYQVQNAIKDGVGIIHKTDSAANLIAAGEAEDNLNIVIMGGLLVDDDLWKGAEYQESNLWIATSFGAFRALKYTENTDLSNYLNLSDAADLLGGTRQRSLAYYNTIIPTISVSDYGAGFTDSDVQNLTTAGITTYGNNRTEINVILGQVVTTYKKNESGMDDETYKFLNNVDVVSALAELLFDEVKVQLGQRRINATLYGFIIAFLVNWFSLMTTPDYQLTRRDGLETFKQSITSLNIVPETGAASVDLSAAIVTQFRRLDATLKPVFNF